MSLLLAFQFKWRNSRCLSVLLKLFFYKMSKEVKLDFRLGQPYTKWGIEMFST